MSPPAKIATITVVAVYGLIGAAAGIGWLLAHSPLIGTGLMILGASGGTWLVIYGLEGGFHK